MKLDIHYKIMRTVIVSLGLLIVWLLIVAVTGVTVPDIQTVHAARSIHVTGMAIPAVAAAPTPIEGTALTTDVNVDFLVIANKNAGAQTVTVVDCTAVTPFSLLTAAPIPATTTWILPLGGMRFRSCFKWSASSTDVQGSLVGSR